MKIDLQETRVGGFNYEFLRTISCHSRGPPPEAMLAALVNDLSTISDEFVLVLDDYHVLDAQPIDQALAYLVEHLPPHAPGHRWRQSLQTSPSIQ